MVIIYTVAIRAPGKCLFQSVTLWDYHKNFLGAQNLHFSSCLMWHTSFTKEGHVIITEGLENRIPFANI